MDDPVESLRSDPALGPLVDEHGPISIDPAPDAFERLLVSIVRQQVSMDAAAAIEERLFEAVQPSPAGILAADIETMREAGLSEAKTEYVRNVARAWRENDWDRTHFAEMSDEAVLDELTAIRGVGTWTGKMFLMFALGRKDVFPVEDLGIRKAMWHVVDEDLSRPEMVETATRWRPFRSYASEYLWRQID